MTNLKIVAALLLMSLGAPHLVVGEEVNVSRGNLSAQYVARLESLLLSLKET